MMDFRLDLSCIMHVRILMMMMMMMDISESTLSSELKPKIYATDTILTMSAPNDTIFVLGIGDQQTISIREMLNDLKTTEQNIDTMKADLSFLQNSLSDTLDDITNSSNTASERMRQIMACAENDQILSVDGKCISPVVTCGKLQATENISVNMSPEGLAYERLPGTLAKFICRDGFANPATTQAVCLSNGSWSRPMATSCEDSCNLLEEYCSICGNNTCYECTAPYAIRDGKCGRITSCNDAEVSGEYILISGLSVYCLVADGYKWLKINSWSRTYSTTSSANSPDLCGTARGINCKLSDYDINDYITDPHNQRIYRLEAEGRAKKIYLHTANDYDDLEKSFGIGPRSTRAMVKTDFNYEELLYDAGVFTQDWIDFYYVSKNNYRTYNTCERYFMGHRYFDCYPSGRGQRCISSGATCIDTPTRYGLIPGWTMYIATVSTPR